MKGIRLAENSFLYMFSKTSLFQITQYSCNFLNLAPDGCTQYFFGATSDTVQTFNYVGGQHLANQDQNICIRWTKRTMRSSILLKEIGHSHPNVASLSKFLNSNCCIRGWFIDFWTTWCRKTDQGKIEQRTNSCEFSQTGLLHCLTVHVVIRLTGIH